MKHSLYIKFLLVYLGFAVLGVVLIATLGVGLNKSYRLNLIEEQLYDEAYYIVSTFKTDLLLEDVITDPRLDSIQALEKSRDCRLWILDPSSKVLYPQTNLVITDFDPAKSNSHHAFTSRLADSQAEDQICVYAPIVSGFKTTGYVIISYPRSAAMAQINQATNVLYVIALGVFLISLILLLFIHILILKPIKQITKAASEYASGNLEYKYNYSSNDEIGVLSKTQLFMASALASTAEDQRKFITNVSHDFRSPLTSIRGYLEAILDGTIPPELEGKYLRIVKDETDRLSQLTQSILDLNTFGKSGVILNISDFDIHHEIKKILATFEGRCSEKHIVFELTFASRELFVHADLGRIQQALYNLIDNAIKFSPQNSTIFIETSENKGKVYVSVKDQGPGISAENLGKIWDRFYKVDPSRGRDKKGSGLGLSITREIIQAHGENIDVISTEGVGTEFIFSLMPTKTE